MSGRKKLFLDLGLLYCAAIWGSTFIVVKDALDGVDPVVMVAIRFLLSAVLMLPWVLKRPDKTALMKEGLVLSLILAALYISQTIGLLYTTASNSGFITGLFIIFIPLFLFAFRGKKLSPLQWLSVGLAVAGMWLLTGGISGLNRGDALALVAAATYAAHVIITDGYVKADADPVMLAFHQFWMVSALSFAAAGAAGCGFHVAGAKSWAVITFLAVFPTLIAFYIQLLAQKESEPLRVGLIFAFEPVFAALFAWTLGGEKLVAVKAAGGSLIVAAMMLGEISKLNLKRAASKEVLPV